MAPTRWTLTRGIAVVPGLGTGIRQRTVAFILWATNHYSTPLALRDDDACTEDTLTPPAPADLSSAAGVSVCWESSVGETHTIGLGAQLWGAQGTEADACVKKERYRVHLVKLPLWTVRFD